MTGHEGHQPRPACSARRRRRQAGTRAAALLGDRVRVFCHHHQAIARLAPGLRLAGHAEDGTVEAVEVFGRAFAVGVPWHPEEDSEDTRLFAGLVAAARQHQERRYREQRKEGGA